MNIYIFFFSRKYKLLQLTEQFHLISSDPASTSASINIPQCSRFDLPSSPRCWSSSSSQDEVVFLYLNISTKDCLIWSAAFRKWSCSRPPCKNFWPLFAAGFFIIPTSLSPWPGFKGHRAALPFDTPRQPRRLACDASAQIFPAISFSLCLVF